MDSRKKQLEMVNSFIDAKDAEEAKIDNFLETIAMIESSGGKNFNHPEIKSGIHKGHSAAGRWGLMPNSMQEIYNRARRQGAASPEMSKAVKMKPDEMKAYVEQNPSVEKEFASYLARYVLDRQKGDEEKAAASWFWGHNLSPQTIEKRDYLNDDYVQKYRKYKKLLEEKNNGRQIEDEM